MDQTTLFLQMLTRNMNPVGTFVPLRKGVPGTPLLNWPYARAKHALGTLNRTGNDIYVTVNANDMEGRRAENITQVRCIYADYDEGVPNEWKLRPSMLVESSPGKAQAYWMLKDFEEPSARWAAVERAVVWGTGADKNVCDVARVLRLPGFMNHKYPEKPVAKILFWQESFFSMDVIEGAYGAMAPPAQMAAGNIQSPEDEVKVRRYKLWLEAAGEPQASSSGRLPVGRNWLFRKAAAGVFDFDLPAATVADVLANHITELDYDDAVSFANDAEKYGHGVKGSAYVRTTKVELVEE